MNGINRERRSETNRSAYLARKERQIRSIVKTAKDITRLGGGKVKFTCAEREGQR